MSDWDFDHQKAETAWTIRDLCDRQGLREGVSINLDMQFVPGDSADKQGLVRALGMFGYGVTLPADEDMVQAEVTRIPFTLDGIWEHEERCTRIALARGFTPDGWGFWEP